MPEMERESWTASNFFELAGPAGLLGLLIGVVVLALAIRLAIRCGPRRHAHALFAAAWIPLALLLSGTAFGRFAALREIVVLGPAVTAKDVAAGLQIETALSATCGWGLLLGLVGAVAALARSRETT